MFEELTNQELAEELTAAGLKLDSAYQAWREAAGERNRAKWADFCDPHDLDNLQIQAAEKYQAWQEAGKYYDIVFHAYEARG